MIEADVKGDEPIDLPDINALCAVLAESVTRDRPYTLFSRPCLGHSKQEPGEQQQCRDADQRPFDRLL